MDSAGHDILGLFGLNSFDFDFFAHFEPPFCLPTKRFKSFADLKKVADDIQARKAELGVDGAFTSAGMDGSSDWRFKTHLANLPIYYEYKADGIGSTDAIKGTYLDNYKQIWDLYITDSTCDPTLLASKTGNDAVAEFVGKKAVFYQNGTWAYSDVKDLGDDNLGMPGLDGLEKMAALMKDLRAEPPADIAGVAVTQRTDYSDGTITHCASGAVTASELKGSNVLRYALADGTVILVRPSGTEPKIKVYILTLGKDPAQRDENIEKYSRWALALQK